MFQNNHLMPDISFWNCYIYHASLCFIRSDTNSYCHGSFGTWYS